MHRSRKLIFVGAIVAACALAFQPLRADDPPKEPAPAKPAPTGLFAAAKLKLEAQQLSDRGQILEAIEKMKQALDLTKAAFPAPKYPDGHMAIAACLNDLGLLHEDNGAYDKALACLNQALAMNRALYPAARFPDGHAYLANSLDVLAGLLVFMGACEKALPHYEEALAMRKKLYPESKYPNGYPQLVASLGNLATGLRKMGALERALPYHEQALAMCQTLYPTSKYPDGHPELASALDNLGQLRQDMGLYEKALVLYERALTMRQKLYPADQAHDGNRAVAISLNNVGALYLDLGALDKALPYFEQALAIKRKVFPRSRFPEGHPELTADLNNLAVLLNELGESAKALAYQQQSLTMNRKLYPAAKYPDGHPSLVHCLINLGNLLRRTGAAEKALAHFQEALQMSQRLYPVAQYPNGHPDLLLVRSNLGALLFSIEEDEKALQQFEQMLALGRKLYPPTRYPDGHPELENSLHNLAFVMLHMGRTAEACANFEQARAMAEKQIAHVLATASEADALSFVQSHGAASRNGLLIASRFLPGSEESVYRAVWKCKAVLTRALEGRYASARTAGTEFASKVDRLRAIRRGLDRLLQDGRMEPSERDQLLAALSGERDQLERELAAVLPVRQRWKERDQLGPEDLAKCLPPGSALVDLLSCTFSSQDATAPAQQDTKATRIYIAFVLAAGQPVKRVELLDADPIDRAVRAWRQDIEARRNSTAPERLRELVWAKIAAQIPAGTRTVFIAPDGDLARLPWAALPGSKPGTVLLEEFEGGMATVPHATFLLEQLRFPPRFDGPESWLAVGAVNYGQSPWPKLPGTDVELKALVPVGSARRASLSGMEATPKRVSSALATARYAHLATHGFFNENELMAEKKREREARKNWQFVESGTPRRVAAKNPLSFTGLVLADGEVLTGLSLVDLPLENLRLVTLSACETGLGDLSGGEGVQGLQRAFHLAGCPNVIASLWNVNDAATAALMAKFYHELWTNQKPPIEALREAQLTIYHHPELIPDLAGERGAPKLKEAVAVKIGEPGNLVAGSRRADTKLWAAFVLSGLGK
ncbi:MAG TPA: CHAT domain-containing tetratricopeptide repeat protein [Gemmataceae bacterium]|nr:CHAT domain-containing tetratricopeptide repeat protein [Gemmataceae bacterium]